MISPSLRTISLQTKKRKRKKQKCYWSNDKLGGKIMTELIRLRAKTYSYLTDDGFENKKAKGTKSCFIKGKSKFEDYKNCLEATQLEHKINHLEKYKNDADRGS